MRLLGVHSTDPVVFLRSGQYGATARIEHGHSVVVLGRLTERGRLIPSRRLPFTPHHRYRDAVLLNLSAAMNRRGDALVAWSYESSGDVQAGPDHTLVAFIPAKGRRVIRELAPRFATSLQTAINDQGVGVALFDTQVAVRIGRGVRADAQLVGPPFLSVSDVEAPIHLDVDRRGHFHFVACRARSDGSTDVETLEASADGRFGRPTHDYTIDEPLASWPVAARNERGDEVVAWASARQAPRRDTGPVRAAIRRDGVWRGPVELSPDLRGYLAVAVGQEGTALVAYPRADAPNDQTKMTAAVAPPGQSFTVARVLSGSVGATGPSAVVDRHGRAVVAWIGWHTAAAVAPPGGAFGRPAKLGECLYPELQLDARGEAVALLECRSYYPPRDHRGERALTPARGSNRSTGEARPGWIRTSDLCLTDLVGALSTQSHEFRTNWAPHNVRFDDTGVKRLHHPIVGDLDLTYEAMELSADAGLTEFAYTAEAGSKSEEALNLLGSWAATDKVGPDLESRLR